MLRGVVLAAGLAMLAGGAVAMGTGWPAGLWLLIAGGMITVGTLVERIVYKPLLREGPGAGWVRTAERFIDPGSGLPVEVFYNPATGERQYVSPDAGRKR